MSDFGVSARMPSCMRRHYEKVIVACGFILVFLSVGLPGAAFSVYQSYLVELPGVGSIGGSAVLLVRTFVSFVSMLFTAAYYDRLDCRMGAALACVFNMVGFFLFGTAKTLPMLCFAAVFPGLAYGLGGMVASTLLIGRWYKGDLGTALGIVAVGSGVAGFAVPPCVAALVEAFSLSVAFYAEAALIALLTLLIALLVRNDPADLGLEAHTGKPMSAKSGKARTPKSGKPWQGEPLPASITLAMIFAIVCLGCSAAGGGGYLGVLMTSEGFGPMTAAFMVSIMGACLSVGKLLNGLAFDLIGTRKGSILFFAVLTCGTTLCCSLLFVKSTVIAFLGAACYGLGGAIASVGIPMWSLELSSVTERPRTIKNYQSAYAFGAFVFNLFPGVLAELTGTYASSYALLSVLTVVCAAVILRVYRKVF